MIMTGKWRWNSVIITGSDFFRVERIFWVSTHYRGTQIGVAATENYVGALEVVLGQQELVLQQRGWCCSNGDGVAATGMVLQQREWCCSNRDGVAATGNGVAATGMVLQQREWCCSNGNGVAATGMVLQQRRWFLLHPCSQLLPTFYLQNLKI